MRMVLIALLCLLLAACGDRSIPAASALSSSECELLVARETDALPKGAPIRQQMLASCLSGSSHYQRAYFQCMSESKYRDFRDCAYKARGRDRIAREPWLKDRQLGEYGSFSGTANSVLDSTYRGEDPRTTLSPMMRNLYLDQRDRAFRSTGQAPPNDRNAPGDRGASSFTRNGKTYWVAFESYVELHLVKTMVESEAGISEVTCARFGAMERPAPDRGFCAALVNQHLEAH